MSPHWVHETSRPGTIEPVHAWQNPSKAIECEQETHCEGHTERRSVLRTMPCPPARDVPALLVVGLTVQNALSTVELFPQDNPRKVMGESEASKRPSSVGSPLDTLG